MKTIVQAVRLTSPTKTGDSQIVKTCALCTFRALRTLADYASQLPEVASQAASDIARAWEESSRPKL